LFDFQTYMTELTGLQVSNASLYDGASAVAEAALLGLRIKKAESFVYVSKAVHPEYRQVIQTYLNPQGHKIQEIELKGTETDIEALKAALWPNSVVVIQYPNSFGNILSFGGPHAGFLTARFDDIRQMPGRIVGGTVDRNNKECFVLTFQA